VLPVPAPATAELLTGKPIYARSRSRTHHSHRRSHRRNTCERFRAATSHKDHRHRLRRRRQGFPGSCQRPARPDWRIDRRPRVHTVAVLEANNRRFQPPGPRLRHGTPARSGRTGRTLEYVLMKKKRPGTLVRVIAKPEDRETLAQLMFAETSTSDSGSTPPSAASRPAASWKWENSARPGPNQNLRRRLLRARIRGLPQTGDRFRHSAQTEFSRRPISLISKNIR